MANRLDYGRLNIGDCGYKAIADAIMATPQRAYNANGLTFDFHQGRIRAAYASGGRTRSQAIESDGEVPGINLNNPTGRRIGSAISATANQLRS